MKTMLTTIDNPFNPFKDFDSWFLFDVEKGYNSCAYLARIAKTSNEFTEQEWEAIQAGAISPSKLKTIINNADLDTLRQMAMPRSTKQLSQSKINHIATLKASGYTNAQIAQKLGVSTSTVSKYLS